ncbi:hypothetical protein CYY_003602 [Polysphondylium violaceum]|uniref:Citrate transporter-like domain-containing protein n=1 Tax=Polysphondylium violaceum TaxID=133409 RepID=A0A8J4PWJ6_9MYCE|nr:hypothetical protein CYY_003602 [Polysphondylium violaceum]
MSHVIELNDGAKKYFSGFIFLISLILICTKIERFPIGRAAVSLIGSTLMVIFNIVPPEEIKNAINFDTLILLMSMMMLSNYMEKANIWDIASKILLYKCKSPVVFMIRVCLISAVLSSILTNDTVCVTLTPIIITACKQSNLPLFPYLMAVATSANIGSAALPVGNPQNMIIATASGLSFITFFKVSVVSSLIGIVINSSLLYLYFRKSLLSGSKGKDGYINTNDHSIIDDGAPIEASIIYKEQDNSHHIEKINDNYIVNIRKVENVQLEQDEEEEEDQIELESIQLDKSIQHNYPNRNNNGAILVSNSEMDDNNDLELLNKNTSSNKIYGSDIKSNLNRYYEKYKPFLSMLYFYKPGIIIILVLIGFFLGFHMGFTVMVGVSILIVLERKDINDVIVSVDWSLLIFFSGLFVLVDGFDREFSSLAWTVLEPFVPLASSSVLKILVFTIIVLVACNILGNVPLVLALCPRLLEEMAPDFTWLLLAFVSTVAGNLTLIGSVANLIVAEKAKFDYQMGFYEYLKFGVPSTLLVIVVGVPIVVLIAST